MNVDPNYLVPGVFVTLDNTLANTSAGETFKTVIVGQMLDTGTATAGEIVQVFSLADAQGKAGVGSMLAEMAETWFDGNVSNELYLIPMADASGAVANETHIEMLGLASTAGTYTVIINGTAVNVGVQVGDTADDLASGLETLINANTMLPCTAVAGGSSVVCTTKNAGTLSNEITYILDNTNLPTGITEPGGGAIGVAIQGATDPSMADALDALPDDLYNLIVTPYTDATSLTALKTELARRWGNLVQLDGHAVGSFGGVIGDVVDKGNLLNDENLTLMDAGSSNGTPAYLNCCAVASQIASSASVDPARPFRTLPLVGVDGDSLSGKRKKSERQSILTAGISTHTIGNDGTVYIERLRTTYKTNALGAPDNSYQNTNTRLNLSYIRQSFINFCLSKWPRHKIAEDGFKIGAGQPIATPSSVKGALVTEWYAGLMDLGLVEDLDGFAEAITCEIDANNRSRMNIYTRPDLIGQFYQIDNTLQFII